MVASNRQNASVATDERNLRAGLVVDKPEAVVAIAENNLPAVGVITESNWLTVEVTARKENVAVAEMAESKLAVLEGSAGNRENVVAVGEKAERS